MQALLGSNIIYKMASPKLLFTNQARVLSALFEHHLLQKSSLAEITKKPFKKWISMDCLEEFTYNEEKATIYDELFGPENTGQEDTSTGLKVTFNTAQIDHFETQEESTSKYVKPNDIYYVNPIIFNQFLVPTCSTILKVNSSSKKKYVKMFYIYF